MYELAAPAQSTPPKSAPMDAHAKSGHVAIRLLALAADCRVSTLLLANVIYIDTDWFSESRHVRPSTAPASCACSRQIYRS